MVFYIRHSPIVNFLLIKTDIDIPKSNFSVSKKVKKISRVHPPCKQFRETFDFTHHYVNVTEQSTCRKTMNGQA